MCRRCGPLFFEEPNSFSPAQDADALAMHQRCEDLPVGVPCIAKRCVDSARASCSVSVRTRHARAMRMAGGRARGGGCRTPSLRLGQCAPAPGKP
eukprot:6617835-Pyramimonas_sp.AAC.1